jgi:hypothetical protein
MICCSNSFIRINKSNSVFRQKVGSPKTKNGTRWVNVKPYVMQMLKGLAFQTRRKTPLVHSTVLNKHLHPVVCKPGLNVAECTVSVING